MCEASSQLPLGALLGTQVWVGKLHGGMDGEFDPAQASFHSGGKIYDFPRNENCEKQYCNIEGVYWVEGGDEATAEGEGEDAPQVWTSFVALREERVPRAYAGRSERTTSTGRAPRVCKIERRVSRGRQGTEDLPWPLVAGARGGLGQDEGQRKAAQQLLRQGPVVSPLFHPLGGTVSCVHQARRCVKKWGVQRLGLASEMSSRGHPNLIWIRMLSAASLRGGREHWQLPLVFRIWL